MKNFGLIALVMLSCNQQQKKDTTLEKDTNNTTSVDNNVPEGITTGCYQMVIEKDTANMNITVSGNEVSGDLAYKRYEKDSNLGTLKGNIEKDRIAGWYNFSSEGMNSVRQVVFKISGNQLSEGYGDVKQKGDTVIFSYPQTLNFEEKHSFVKVICQ